ncbi:chaperone protein dnaJ 13 [Selaginella moellendorffii]|uniref:chaperone protein dnaJ 13 n=1 Tax=Selaginella moellendorffii TaxID=88036 RepID=UPI000D1CEE5D|nr:chaperone protein dnaJ 13 [Selaginella moellendorffii]|eukprot:XP_024541454.1 chaperone protein dnaJ 13 [Selaginella moellendorffii]
MEGEQPDRELYALLHLDPDASDEDIKRAYRQWAQVYHPDKHRTLQMQDIATQNFQRIREAYEILSDEKRRQVYDIYGMEGLKSGLELGPKLKTREEVRNEYEKLQARKVEQKLASHVLHSGSMVVYLSLVEAMRSSLLKGAALTAMGMTTQIQAQISKKDTVLAGGNMFLRRNMGGGSMTGVLRHQYCPATSLEFMATLGLRSVLNWQITRQISSHSSGTLSLSYSLRSGHVTLGESWTRQIAENTTATLLLFLGPDPNQAGLVLGWQHKGTKNSISSEIKAGPAAAGISGQVTRQLSGKSKGKVSARLGSTGVELEIGGERSISDHSSAGMFCVIGLQGVSWKFRFTRGGQKFVVPLLLAARFDPVVALGALLLPSTLYVVLKKYLFKPYFLKRAEAKKLEQRKSTVTQVQESRANAEKAQDLLKNVAHRKVAKAEETGGLIIAKAIYGDLKARDGNVSGEDTPPTIDVTIPLQFLVDDSGQLKLYAGVKKAGLMGFCDPCPGEPKQLVVSYTLQGSQFKALVDDYEELTIPQEAHKLSSK